MARKALPEIGLKLFGEDSQQGQGSSAKPIERAYGQHSSTKQLFVNNGLSPLRADLATAKVVSFRKAGPTSTEAGKRLLDMHQLGVSADGELLDQNRFTVAGLVHKNEHLIPQ